jgi:2-aminoadipate transaminase
MTMKITVNRKLDKPLYVQVRDALLAAIKKGALKPGDRLPTVVAFAKQVGVTQATIRRACKDLTEAGHLTAQVGRGTFVADPNERSARECTATRTSAMQAQAMGSQRSSTTGNSLDPEFALAARRLRMGVSRSLDDLMALAQRPGLIRFTVGVPNPAIARDGILKDMVLDALEAGQNAYQGYGPTAGLPQLREELARRFTESGTEVSPEQILITSGSQQAVSILSQAALENRRRIICETPCYVGVPRAFGAIGHWVESLPRDHEGPMPERLERFRDGKPSLLYLCPELHNPMGTDLSAERATMLVEWAREQDALLAADEIFHDLRFEGEPSPQSLLTKTGADRAVVLGSASKSFMCGLRVGWLVTSPERVRSLGALKRAMDLGCAPLMEGTLLSLLRTGEYEAHLLRARAQLRANRDAVLEALERHMPEGVTWTKPRGGFNMWVELPEGYSSIAFYLLALEQGVAIVPGPQMDVDHRFVNAFALRYSCVETDDIHKGIERLGNAARVLLKQPPSDPGLSGLGGYL